MSIKQTLRLHQPGIITVCSDKSDNNPATLYSCGSDTNLGQWLLKDNDISDREITVDDQCTSAIACYNQYIYFGAKRKNQSGIIQNVVLQKDVTCEEDVGRAIMSFSDEVTSLDVGFDGSFIIGGSADFKVKCCPLNDDNDALEMWRYEMDGVVCHVATNPRLSMCSISASNGVVKILSIQNGAMEVASFHAFSPFNPRSGSSRMRMCWSNDGNSLFIPMEGYISDVRFPSWSETRRFVTIGSEGIPVNDICTSCDTLAASNVKNKLYIFEMHSGAIHYEIDCAKGDLFSCQIPPLSTIADEEDDISKVKTMYTVAEEDFIQPARTELVARPNSQFFSKDLLVIPSTLHNASGISNGIGCLKWNAFGRILSTEVDNEPTIEIIFNDTSVHEEISIDNSLTKFVIGDLNSNIVALASTKNDKGESELSVRHVGSWDRDSRLWSVTMNSNEVIETLAVGAEFIVVFTNLRYFRIFSATGVCRLIFSHAGPLCSITAGGSIFVAVTYSSTLVMNGDNNVEHTYQSITYKVDVKSTDVVKNFVCNPLALSPGSNLRWISISNAESVCTMDDSNCVRFLAKNGIWYPISALSVQTGHSIWPIAVTEKPEPKFKFVHCKSQQPSYERNEVPQNIKWKVPVCEEETDKGKLEQDLLLNELLQKAGNSVLLDSEHPKILMKYFALCCLKHRDARAFELAHLTKQAQHLQFMSGYATKHGRNILNNKILMLGRDKMVSDKSILQPSNIMNAAPSNPRQVVLQKRRSTNITRLVEDGAISSSDSSVLTNAVESSSLPKKHRTVAENPKDDFLDTL